MVPDSKNQRVVSANEPVGTVPPVKESLTAPEESSATQAAGAREPEVICIIRDIVATYTRTRYFIGDVSATVGDYRDAVIYLDTLSDRLRVAESLVAELEAHDEFAHAKSCHICKGTYTPLCSAFQPMSGRMHNYTQLQTANARFARDSMRMEWLQRHANSVEAIDPESDASAWVVAFIETAEEGGSTLREAVDAAMVLHEKNYPGVLATLSEVQR